MVTPASIPDPGGPDAIRCRTSSVLDRRSVAAVRERRPTTSADAWAGPFGCRVSTPARWPGGRDGDRQRQRTQPRGGLVHRSRCDRRTGYRRSCDQRLHDREFVIALSSSRSAMERDDHLAAHADPTRTCGASHRRSGSTRHRLSIGLPAPRPVRIDVTCVARINRPTHMTRPRRHRDHPAPFSLYSTMSPGAPVRPRPARRSL